ncbi:MAG: heme biosynthesis protein [Bdellovibrio sp. ArHS]|uniref:radical SAM/SPASM domain-containing protein n=1 Tax=Bdellovibrio sp. ArHS TaxID=1569284 RepID=UPI0005825388|nr:radical SAM protein [Bdellovibrio sp. ArHS]KHD89253.1 MAG: heme biosynthesis protein [Bdellovibrio sp. ArHS]
MEQRRYKDIVAFKWGQNAPLAFHARNLEVAEISEDTWASMEDAAKSTEAGHELAIWESDANPDVKSGKLEPGIRSLTINVTQICNLKCTYCAAGGDGTYGEAQTKINVEKTLPQLQFFLERLPANSNFRITFLGGEPLLYPEGIQEIANYVRLMAAGRNIRPQFSIVTNGTLMNEKTLSVLKNIKANITISLDGPASINDKARPTKNGTGSTELVIEGLKLLSTARESLGRLTLHGVFNSDNMNLVSAYDFYREFDVDKYEFTYSVADNDEASNKEFVQQMNHIAKKAFTLGGETELRKIGAFDQYFSALDNQQQTENYCGAGKSFLMVDAKNNLFTCPWEVGNKAEQVGQGSHLDLEKLEQYQSPLIEKNSCQSCWARYLCGGGCMFIHKQSTGNKHQKDGQFCYRTRSLISTALLYYKISRESC